eukprot:g2720.t1
MKCSGHFRSLGANISKVRSILMDRFDSSQLKLLRKSGNLRFLNHIVDNLDTKVKLARIQDLRVVRMDGDSASKAGEREDGRSTLPDVTTTKTMTIDIIWDVMDSAIADLYRRQIRALVEGKDPPRSLSKAYVPTVRRLRLEGSAEPSAGASSKSPPTPKLLDQAPVWQDGSSTNACQLCSAKFTVFYRKHHCRICGKGPNDDYLEYLRSYPTILGRQKAGAERKDGFIALGSEKTCSRKAARIDYNKDIRKFEIEALGKNGINVEGKYIGKGEKAVLERKFAVRIGTRKFYFLQAIEDEESNSPAASQTSSGRSSSLSETTTAATTTASSLSVFNDTKVSNAHSSNAKPNKTYDQLIAEAFSGVFKGKFVSAKNISLWLQSTYPFYRSYEEMRLRKSLAKRLNFLTNIYDKKTVYTDEGKRSRVLFGLHGSSDASETMKKRDGAAPATASSEGGDIGTQPTKKRRVALTNLSDTPLASEAFGSSSLLE